MHALTRPMSETYCWQSRIASGSQAARCCGVHCCAAAGLLNRPGARRHDAPAPQLGHIAKPINLVIRCVLPHIRLVSGVPESVEVRAAHAGLGIVGQNGGDADLRLISFMSLSGPSSCGNVLIRERTPFLSRLRSQSL